MIYFWFRGKP